MTQATSIPLLQAAIDALQAVHSPLPISELRRRLPDPRPGYVELERLILIREDVFKLSRKW